VTNQEIILLICAIGYGWSSWRAGLKQGADNAIELLRSKKIITLNNKGDIIPNKFYQEEED
jgi:hypothetical protein